MAFFLNPLVITSFLVVFSLVSTAVPFTSGELGLPAETHLHLYLHEILTGPNARAVAVAGPVDNSTRFGIVLAVDHYLRKGPELTSNVTGHAQGRVSGASQEEVAYLFAMNFVFTEGEFKGSTLAVYGRGVRQSSTREWSIIGGTRQFCRARGYVFGKKLAAPAGTNHIEVDLFISH